MYRLFLLASCCVSSGCCSKLPNARPLEGVNKVFFGEPQVSVSKFPPVVEFFVQKIQSQYSNYAHEDLSRPPTWDKPVYTLSPQDKLVFTTPPAATVNATKNGTELIADASQHSSEIIQEALPVNVTGAEPVRNETNFEDFSYEELDETTEKLFEIVNPTHTVDTSNKSVVHITPRPKTTTSKTTTVDEKSSLELNVTLVDSDQDTIKRKS